MLTLALRPQKPRLANLYHVTVERGDDQLVLPPLSLREVYVVAGSLEQAIVIAKQRIIDVVSRANTFTALTPDMLEVTEIKLEKAGVVL